jgi:hypothetical protein
MSKLSLSKTYYPFGILLFGLGIAQVIAFIQVYLSNIELHRTISALSGAGYLTVPNVVAMNRLQEFWPAFWGGLFFTLSIGAGISLAGMAAGWVWSSLCGRNKFVLFLFLSIWGGLLIISNIHGLALYPTLYIVLIAPILFFLTVKWAAHSATRTTGRLRWLHILPIPLLALLWSTQLDADLFVDLRDNLLLSNSLGKKINQFYYRYTLYPAEAFKSLDQKLIRTCRLEDMSNPTLKKKLTIRLLANDYLPVPGALKADLKINLNDKNLVFSDNDHIILKVNVRQFFAKPQKAFQKYSEAKDRHGAFRQFTYLSLVVGFPILIYIFLHFLLYYPTALFFGQKNSAIIASLMCLMIGILVLVYFQSNRSSNIQIKNIDEALNSKNLSVRIAALKLVQQKQLDVAEYRSYAELLQSPHPRERYWLAVAMAVSRSQKTFRDLIEVLDDKNTNVRSMAFQSLGARNNRQAIRPILEKIRTSHDWYDPLYAYGALRSLGWKQKKLP